MRASLTLLLVAGACTHHRPIVDINDVAGKDVTVETYDGVDIAVTAQESDGLITFRAETGYIAPALVRRVVEIRRARGALEGFGIGLLIGAAGGAVIGLADGDDPCTDDHGGCFLAFSAGEKALLGGVFFGGLGGLIGLVVGAARGSHFVYSSGDSARVMPTGPPGSVGGVTITF